MLQIVEGWTMTYRGFPICTLPAAGPAASPQGWPLKTISQHPGEAAHDLRNSLLATREPPGRDIAPNAQPDRRSL